MRKQSPRKWYQAFAFTMMPLAEDQVCVAEPWDALPSRFYGCRQDLSNFREATGCVQCIAKLMNAIDVSGLGCVPVEDTELLVGVGLRDSDDHGHLVQPKHLGLVFAFETGAAVGKHSPSYSPHQEEAAEMHPSPLGTGCSAPPRQGLVAGSDCSCAVLATRERAFRTGKRSAGWCHRVTRHQRAVGHRE